MGDKRNYLLEGLLPRQSEEDVSGNIRYTISMSLLT